MKINREGEDAIPVFFTNIKESNGANPVERLAAIEYNAEIHIGVGPKY